MSSTTTHILHIPDALIAWGKHPAQARHWRVPWAHEVERLMAKTQMPCATCGTDFEDDPEHRLYCDGQGTVTLRPLAGRGATRLWACLDALVGHAIRAGRHDLLAELDLFTCAILKLRVTLSDGRRSASVGEGGQWAAAVVERLVRANAGQDAVDFVAHARSLANEVFPRAEIGAIVTPDAAVEQCAGCGEVDHVILLQMDSGSSYCRKCWEHLARPWPRVTSHGGRIKLHWNEHA